MTVGEVFDGMVGGTRPTTFGAVGSVIMIMILLRCRRRRSRWLSTDGYTRGCGRGRGGRHERCTEIDV